MDVNKTQRIAYMQGFKAGHEKFEAEFETLLETKEQYEKDLSALLCKDIPAMAKRRAKLVEANHIIVNEFEKVINLLPVGITTIDEHKAILEQYKSE